MAWIDESYDQMGSELGNGTYCAEEHCDLGGGDCPVCQAVMAITPTSKAVFLAYAADAGNWSGMPLVGGNVGGTQAERGNLTQLKKAGLILTQVDGRDVWIIFTDVGKRLAKAFGIDGF